VAPTSDGLPCFTGEAVECENADADAFDTKNLRNYVLVRLAITATTPTEWIFKPHAVKGIPGPAVAKWTERLRRLPRASTS
jgi:hypothetical protein